MIKSIQIKNSSVFDDFILDFTPNFNVITGISGSGKSVFINFLLSAFGIKKSELDYLVLNFDNGNSESLIINNKKYFLKKHNKIQKISKKELSELSFFVKYISFSNKSTNSINKFVGEIDILEILDSMIESFDNEFLQQKLNFKSLFLEFKEIEFKINTIQKNETHLQELIELTESEILNISKIDPKIGEYEELMSKKKLLSKKEKMQNAIDILLNKLDDEVFKYLEILEIDYAIFKDSFFDIMSKVEDESNKLLFIDHNIEDLLERISIISDLIRRYGSEENALNHLSSQIIKLDEYKNLSYIKNDLQQKYEFLKNEILKESLILSNKRKEAINELNFEFNKIVSALKISNVKLGLSKIDMKIFGEDKIDVLLNNKNKSSSGEQNRIKLALLCLSGLFSKKTGVLILDEIDSNLSGEESESVAKLLKNLGKKYQIFAISHQIFMPLLCDYHYLVTKNNKSNIKLLDDEGRINEIARIIGGSNKNETLKYAKVRFQINREGGKCD